MVRVARIVVVLIGVQLIGAAIASGGQHSTPSYRLGTAAGPFGYATVLADFNEDGAPDTVVADKAGPAPSAYAYTLEFAMSGAVPYTVRFESQQPALTIAVADVDADRDADIVILTPVAEARVGVWLNDGSGRFTRTPASSFGTPRSAPGSRLNRPRVHTSVVAVPSGRSATELVNELHVAQSRVGTRLTSIADHRSARDGCGSDRLRAPPATSSVSS